MRPRTATPAGGLGRRFFLSGFRRPLAVAAALALALTLCPSPRAASPADGAGHVNRVLEELKQAKDSTATERYELSEDDLNAFVGVVVASRATSNLKSLRLDLQPQGLISGVAVVDMDSMPVSGMFAEMFKRVLSGTQTVETTARLTVANRRAELQIEAARFSGVWVPAWLANSVISRLSTRRPGQIDITEPFDLPFQITDVRVEADRLVIIR